jgi:hypothetical protein
MIDHNRTTLLTWLEENAPTPSLGRALNSGLPITILGAFNPLPDSNSPGFIVRAVSKTGKVYHVAITMPNFRKSNAYMIKYIDWKTYVGGRCVQPLYRGDMPRSAAKAKELGSIERTNEMKETIYEDG